MCQPEGPEGGEGRLDRLVQDEKVQLHGIQMNGASTERNRDTNGWTVGGMAMFFIGFAVPILIWGECMAPSLMPLIETGW